MSFIKKLSSDATEIGSATKTHAVVDGTFFDLINPLAIPGDSTTAVLKAGLYAGAAWVGRGYRDTKTFSL